MLTAWPARRELLHSALMCILPALLAMGAVALLWTDLLRLGTSYIAKTLAVFGAGTVLMLIGLPKYHLFRSIGPANRITIARGALVALLAGLVGERSDTGAPAIATATAVIALMLDGVDGWFARRTNMVSRFGARFDMETDAMLVLVLAVLTWHFGKAGAWVLLSGLLRYAFIAAGRVVPRLRRPLPLSRRRKTIAVAQMLALVVAIAPFVKPLLSTYVAALALFALAFSFLADVTWLLQNQAHSGTTVPKCPKPAS